MSHQGGVNKFEFFLIIVLSRAGRFGTKGLAITFVSSEGDQQVMDAIQARFEVAMAELPESIDPASYSESYFCVPVYTEFSCVELYLVTS